MTVFCQFCHGSFEVPIMPWQLKKWQQGDLIQHVAPFLSAAERELLMSHTCGECFDAMFEDDDE